MGGFEGNTDPAFQTCITGNYVPSAEGGTAFLRRAFLRFFFFGILAFYRSMPDNNTNLNLKTLILNGPSRQ